VLQRPPPTPGAARARSSRARRKQGVDLQGAGPRAPPGRCHAPGQSGSLPDELSPELIESELEAIVAAGRARHRER
jgi:hypothetical protein